jgi:hypothetical protein
MRQAHKSDHKRGGGGQRGVPKGYPVLRYLWVYVMFENKKTDRIVNIDEEKFEIYSLHVNSCYVNV